MPQSNSCLYYGEENGGKMSGQQSNVISWTGEPVWLGRRIQRNAGLSIEVIMNVNTISSSTTTTTSSSPLAPVSPTQTQQLQNIQKQKPAEQVSAPPPQLQPQPQPSVNTSGQTVGTWINTSA
jgi:hypothetical protein